MKFEWDEHKRQANLRKHGIDFTAATEIFLAPMLIALDTRHDYGEDRWIGIGLVRERVVVIIYTERNNGGIVRIISVRKALKQERIKYEQTFNR